MEYVFIGLLCNILIIFKAGHSVVAGSCGTLEFEKPEVTEGDSAKLIYSPHNIHGSRLWIKADHTKSTELYDSSKPSHDWSYTEHREGDKYTLLFTKVAKADTGDYLVHCGSTYTGRAKLTVMSSGCGSLKARTNNISEGHRAEFIFSIDPGREFIWEKKINLTFKKLPENSRFDRLTSNGFHQYLRIYKSEYIDSGEYRVNCDTAVSNSVYLHILPTVPSAPEFSDVTNIHDCQNCIPAQLNVQVAIECFVTNGSEPIDLNIFKNGEIISNVSRRSENKNAIKFTFVRHEYVPTTADFDVTFTCTVKNPALTIANGNSAVLYIKVQPKTVVLKANSVIENEPSSIECLTTEGRPPVKSEIFIDGHKANNTETTQVVQTGHTYSVTTTTTRLFTRIQNQATILCCSTILNRSCSEKQTLNVKFPPRKVSITEMRKDNQENGDTKVMLKCFVEESNPQSSIEWKGIKNVPRNLSDKMPEYHNSTHGWTFNATWVFNLTKEDNYRNIRCVVRNIAFPDLVLEQSYRPNITYSPTVTISGHKRTETYAGEDVSFSCNVDSNPPSFIRWYNETDLIKELYGANLDLQLVNISFEHSQTYTCKAENSIGGVKSKNVTIVVRDPSEKTEPVTGSDSSSVVGPVVGCAIVIVAALIALVVFLTLRKKRQTASLKRRPTYEVQMEERKPSVHPVGNEPIYNNTAGASGENEVAEEQPEYACVVPKKERAEVKDAETKSNVREDNLVYADLDLVQDSDTAVSRPLMVKYEPTEYVSIDFSKSGTVTTDT